MMKTPAKKRKGKQPRVNLLVVPGVSNGMGDGQRTTIQSTLYTNRKG